MVDITKHSAEDAGEYDYEGDMAKSQLRSIIANAKRLHDMMKEDTNLPEWVQSKITLAEDYISTAANYMESEMNEEASALNVNAEPAKKSSNTKTSAKKERTMQKQADAAQKVVDAVKGKINKINKKPEVDLNAKV